MNTLPPELLEYVLLGTQCLDGPTLALCALVHPRWAAVLREKRPRLAHEENDLYTVYKSLRTCGRTFVTRLEFLFEWICRENATSIYEWFASTNPLFMPNVCHAMVPDWGRDILPAIILGGASWHPNCVYYASEHGRVKDLDAMFASDYRGAFHEAKIVAAMPSDVRVLQWTDDHLDRTASSDDWMPCAKNAATHGNCDVIMWIAQNREGIIEPHVWRECARAALEADDPSVLQLLFDEGLLRNCDWSALPKEVEAQQKCADWIYDKGFGNSHVGDSDFRGLSLEEMFRNEVMWKDPDAMFEELLGETESE